MRKTLWYAACVALALGALVVVEAQQIVPGVNFFRLVDGSASRPSEGYIQDPDTGTYRDAANTWAVTAGGTKRLSVSSTAVTSTVPVVNALGTAAAPSVTGVGYTDTGLYWPNQTGVVAVSSVGTAIAKWSGNSTVGLSLSSLIPLGWSSDVINSAPDVVLSRGAADRLDLASGDSLYLVSGGLGVGVAPGGSGEVAASSIITAASGVATPAGGSTSVALRVGSAAVGIYIGTGAPGIPAAKGSLYIRTDATTTTTRLYINTDGATTWATFTTSS